LRPAACSSGGWFSWFSWSCCCANRSGRSWAEVNDESLEDAASLPAPAVIAEEIVANPTTALEHFASAAVQLNRDETTPAE